jgi:hypothetical protein
MSLFPGTVHQAGLPGASKKQALDLIEETSMLPFLTAYDPLGGTSGSIDPLGALQSYGALADLLLPGVSTITTRSRYLAMLCWALRNAEIHQQLPPGAPGLSERRKAVEPFERLWALACVAARDRGFAGAVDGLRGISYAERAYQHFRQRGRQVTPDFKMLKYQGRTGGVGTYWTALVGGDLVDPDSGALMQEGMELADEFPQPPLPDRELARLARPDEAHRVGLSADELSEWAEDCHLSGATPKEKNRLNEALTAADRRESVAQALDALERQSGLPDLWDVPWLSRLKAQLARIPQAERLGLPTVIQAVIVTEQFHEAALAIFQSVLWWGTERSGDSVDQLLAEDLFIKAADRAREAAGRVLQFRAACDRLEVRRAIESLASFALAIDRVTTHRQVLDETIHRHHRVQSGKLDGGTPKRDWITFDVGNCLRRPSPRYQQSQAPPQPTGSFLTHPYRLEQFVWMLRENTGLRA